MILRLPRGGPRVCDCSKLCLLAIFLVESELALILVVTLRRGCSARVAVLGLGRFEFAAASQSGRRGGARSDRDVRRRARRGRVARRAARRGTRDLRFQINGGPRAPSQQSSGLAGGLRSDLSHCAPSAVRAYRRLSAGKGGDWYATVWGEAPTDGSHGVRLVEIVGIS